MLEGYFKAITGDSLASIQNAGYLQALTSLNRAVALYGLTTSIANFFILMFAFRKSQKWAWWAMLAVGGIGWLWGLIDHITIGANIGITIYSIGMVVFLVGIFLPVRVFFAKPSQGA